MKNLITFIIKLFFIITNGFATTIHVPGDSTTIQRGLNGASTGDTVLVASGTYYENIIWPATIGIYLIGSGQNSCIINGDSSGSVIRFVGDLGSIIDSTTFISGFTLQGGIITNPGGGGIYCGNNINPIISNVTITGNSAERGGGIYCYNSYPTMSNVTITANSAERGGGIYCYNSNINFSSDNRCNIYLNAATYGADIFSNGQFFVVVDTFTVMEPTGYHVSPIDNFSFDILNAVQEQVNADLYVSTSGSNSYDGLTPQTPLKTIQWAMSMILADSANRNTIHLANGIYSPLTTGEYFPLVLIDYVSILGESEIDVIIDANQSDRVFLINETKNNIISHLSITGGYVPYADHGGGIAIDGSNPTLEYLRIYGNVARAGGGINCYSASPYLYKVKIYENSTHADGWSNSGGGIACWHGSSPILQNVSIVNNEVYASGHSNGGGLFCIDGSNPILINVTIAENTISSTYTNGGGIGLHTAYESSHVFLYNSIVYNNYPNEIEVYAGSNSEVFCKASISYSDVNGGEEAFIGNGSGTLIWGPGNIDADPLFCDLGSNDYTLAENSPCVSTGENGVDMGAFGVGCDEILSIENEVSPTLFALHQNYPNPFNPITNIHYELPRNTRVKITIYDIFGREVKRLLNVEQTAGEKTIQWDAKNDLGIPVAAGIYFYQIRAGEYVQTKKMVLLK